MLEQATAARDAKGKAVGEAADPSTRTALLARIKQAQALFVAAGIEYATRGLPLRETAFTSGYAPMIFHPEEWDLPPKP